MPSIIKRGAPWRATIRASGESISRTFETKAQAVTWGAREEARIRGEQSERGKPTTGNELVTAIKTALAEAHETGLSREDQVGGVEVREAGGDASCYRHRPATPEASLEAYAAAGDRHATDREAHPEASARSQAAGAGCRG
jgi:hypothetical protein